MGTCCICLRSRSVRNVPKCKVDLTLCLRCFVIEIWCGIKVGVGLVIGRRLIRAQISMKNTLTAMSKTPAMSQVRLPRRQEGKTSAGNWAWTLNNELCQKRKEKKQRICKRLEQLWTNCKVHKLWKQSTFYFHLGAVFFTALIIRDNTAGLATDE